VPAAEAGGLDEDGGIPDHVIIAYNRANPDRPDA
jgi:hypothetical protein